MTTDSSTFGKVSGGDDLGFKDEHDLAALYAALLDAWNRRNASDFASLFTINGSLIGFDGSQVDGNSNIAAHLGEIFAHHPTPAFGGIVREVRLLGAEIGIVKTVAGMIPAGQTELNPALNAVQSIVALEHSGAWKIELFQNTPAAFHGRPEASERLTAELRLAFQRRDR